jgi:hypothetical protein
MNYPDWFKPHDPYYDQYSIEVDNFTLPEHFDTYLPDFGNEVSCKSIIMPSPRRSAINYTKNDKFMLIGIYKDKGRDPAPFPLVTQKQWAISGNEITIFDATNKVRINDYVYCYNTNVVGQQYLKCVARSSTFFTLKLASLAGGTTGLSASYRIDRIKDFAEENIVFRMFPTFKLITYAEFLDIVNATSPNSLYQTSDIIKNITTDSDVRTPTQITADANYSKSNNFKKVSEIANSMFKLAVEVKGDGYPKFQHNQTFDYNGKPLKLKYDEAGRVIPPNYYDSKYKNENIFVGSILAAENPSSISNADDRVWCYDFYGIDINDIFRGPYNLDIIISRDTSVDSNVDNILRAEANGVPIYPTNQDVYDQFGNIVVGINTNNSLNTIRQRIPLQLDNFGRPLKLPY